MRVTSLFIDEASESVRFMEVRGVVDETFTMWVYEFVRVEEEEGAK